MDQKQDKAKRISAQDLAQAARAGVERALAARQGMTELTAEQVQQVSGAAAAARVIKPVVVGRIALPPVCPPPIVKPPVVKPPIVVGFLPVPFDPVI